MISEAFSNKGRTRSFFRSFCLEKNGSGTIIAGRSPKHDIRGPFGGFKCDHVTQGCEAFTARLAVRQSWVEDLTSVVLILASVNDSL